MHCGHPRQGSGTVTISGTNFYMYRDIIIPSLGTLQCLEVSVTQSHAKIECKVSPSDEFSKDTDYQNTKISVDIKGLKSEPAQNFTYALPGCIDTDARIFNNLATEDNGSCIVVGCSDSKAETFVSKAYENNQAMCIYPPQKVRMTLD